MPVCCRHLRRHQRVIEAAGGGVCGGVLPGDIAGQRGQQGIRLVGIQCSIRRICEPPDGLIGCAVGPGGLRDRPQADHLAALEGIAQGLDVRGGDARRLNAPNSSALVCSMQRNLAASTA